MAQRYLLEYILIIFEKKFAKSFLYTNLAFRFYI
jgi:hypothetical protein